MSNVRIPLWLSVYYTSRKQMENEPISGTVHIKRHVILQYKKHK